MKARAGIFLAGRAVRLFKRADRPSRFWQAAFRRPGNPRPLVKSTGRDELGAAKEWALRYLASLEGGEREAALLRPAGFAKIRQEKRHVERELALRVLGAYQRDPYLSQRRLAEALDISLAVANTYTARAEREGTLMKLDRPSGKGSGFEYRLTPAGMALLADLKRAYAHEQLRLYRHLRATFEGFLTQYGGAEIVLFGGSDVAQIARAVLDQAGITPAAIIAEEGPEALARHAVKRHRRHGVLWLASLADPAALMEAAALHLPGMVVLMPPLPAPDV